MKKVTECALVASVSKSWFGSFFSFPAPEMTLPTNKTYLDLIFEAILTLHQGEATTTAGPSLQAIKKHIENQYPDLELKSHYLRSSLKKAIEDKRIVQMRGSYRISAAELRAVVRRPTIMTSVAIAQGESTKKVKKDKTGKATKSKKSEGAAKTKTDKTTKAKKVR